MTVNEFVDFIAMRLNQYKREWEENNRKDEDAFPNELDDETEWLDSFFAWLDSQDDE